MFYDYIKQQNDALTGEKRVFAIHDECKIENFFYKFVIGSWNIGLNFMATNEYLLVTSSIQIIHLFKL